MSACSNISRSSTTEKGAILPWTTQRQQHSSYIQPDLPLERVHFFGGISDPLAVDEVDDPLDPDVESTLEDLESRTEVTI